MSKPDLDIIHSPEAQAFLRSVTEGFYDRSYLSLWMFEVIGREWDEMAAWSRDIKQEIYVQTCTWSIGIWEWVYGFEPDESMTLEERRLRIMSKVRGVRPINPEVMRRRISAVSGADAGLKDFSNPYSFSVTLNITNRPIPMERVLRFIYETKPAHLAVNVEVVFPEIESTLHVGGGVGAQTWVGVPLEPDTYSFQDTLHAGGSFGAAPKISVPNEPDSYHFQDTLHAGGAVGAAPEIGVPNEPDSYHFQDTLHTSGAVSGQTALPVPEDTTQPSATTILRTGGVCTIISNLPPTKGE